MKSQSTQIIAPKRVSSFSVVNLDLVFVSENKYFKKTNGICELCKKSFASGKVVVGTCGHAFHSECVGKVNTLGNSGMPINMGMLSCPIDNIAWEVKKTM